MPILQFGLDDSPKPVRTPKSKPRAGSGILQGAITKRPRIKREAEDESELGSPAKKSKDGPATPHLIVGIDFGTTYSGVAVAHSGLDRDKVHIISSWPGSVEVRHKVPTMIDDQSDNSNYRGWGYGISSTTHCSSWFKLHMAPDDTLSTKDDPLLFQSVGPSLLRIPDGETPEILCEEYLRRLYKHVMERVSTIYGQSVVDALPIKAVLTIPADWDRKYQITLRAAAQRAGIATRNNDSILTIDEPEAAALAAFETNPGQKANSIFKVNNNVVVVDIGGGTIDIITYKVCQTDPLKIGEACTGTSAKCGATMIDRELHRLMGEKYGSAFSSLPVNVIGHGSKFMTESFEPVKKNFTGHGDEHKKEHKIHLAMDINDSPGYVRDLAEVTITSEELAQMFDKVISRAFDMVSEQIEMAQKRNDGPVNLIILCGGMADSKYVQAQFKEFCKNKLDNKVDFIVPHEAWPAIAKGAALHAFAPPIVESRKSRWSYGIGVHRAFDPERDNEEDQYNCPSRGQRVKGHIEWFIKRGESVKDQVRWIHGYIAIRKARQPARDTVGDLELYKSKNVERLKTLHICIPARNLQADKKVRVGHKILVNEKLVEFEAKCGNKLVGLRQTYYEEDGIKPDRYLTCVLESGGKCARDKGGCGDKLRLGFGETKIRDILGKAVVAAIYQATRRITYVHAGREM
ncbi:hypothetical protein GX51_02980 [Blastomyces parvus]|uniref:Hsp70-like protein n=1 Tax=Blastomyces parvus TaxID=2060905 RepID=A0A2B7X8R2_9EURO|nr:hypothetical protein GX51_02980 [Blastomyces parvus]